MTRTRVFTSARLGLTVLLAAISAWPIIACAMRTPLERALSEGAPCGGHALGGGEILGHCPACYVGLAGFVLAMWSLSRRTLAARPARS
jgi:hypothetical protein